MIKEFVDRFMANKAALRAVFAKRHPGDYIGIMQAVIDVVGEDGREYRIFVADMSKGYYEYGDDPEFIFNDFDSHVCNSGVRLAESIIITDNDNDNNHVWLVDIPYGDCHACDALSRINESVERACQDEAQLFDIYNTATPTEQQIEDYMTLALHLVQKVRPMWEFL